jgi:hypothetical protein
MQAYSFNADIPNYYHTGVPVCGPDDSGHAGLSDKLLPQKLLKQKSAEQAEIERHAYYFKFADDAKARLESRGLWTEKTDGTHAFEASPDAREKLKSSFSKFLGSFVNFGSTNEIARPKDLFSGMVHYAQGGMSPMTAIAGGIFVFNTIVSRLKTAFPGQQTHLDQAGRLTYFSSSAAHSIVSGIQPVIQEARYSHSDPVFSIVLVSIEILLGFYNTIAATENSLTRQQLKSGLLTELINTKAQAKSFFQKIRQSENPGPEEAEAYERFMAVISKLDQVSAKEKFANLISAMNVMKEWLWFGGAVVGNETAYKSLANTEIAVSGVELAGTALGKTLLSLVANVTDLVHGIVVACRCQQRIDHGIGIRKLLGAVRKGMTSPGVIPLIKGIDRLVETMVADEKFEQGFSFFRIFKAAVMIAIGIVSIVGLALTLVYAAPFIIGLTAGLVLTAFFIFLIARSVRAADRARDAADQEKAARKIPGASDNNLVNPPTDDVESADNKFLLLQTLSASFVDTPALWEKGTERASLFAALNFNEIDIALLRGLARAKEDREKNIAMVKMQFTRMLDLKIVGD